MPNGLYDILARRHKLIKLIQLTKLIKLTSLNILTTTHHIYIPK